MTHLFTLKKDGKMVGYLELKDGKLVYSNEDKSYISPYCISIEKGRVFSFSPPCYGSYYEHDECDFDTAHPFVCKDKNGKNVFAGDKVKWVLGDDATAPGQEEELEAAIAGGFLVFDVEGIDFVEASRFKDIELIEEKDE